LCGICFVKRKDGTNANKQIKRLYFGQKDRGCEGYGFVNIDTMLHFRERFEHQILSDLSKNRGSEILFHHRHPTSTTNTKETAHPIYSGNNFTNKYYIVHNGVINNSFQLYKEHTERGLKYSTFIGIEGKEILRPIFNDSECLLMELGLYLEGKKQVIDTKGSVAFILLETNKKGVPLNLYYGRNYGSDLKFLHSDTEIIISSEGDGKDIDVHELNTYCYKTGEFSKKKLNFERGFATSYYDYDEDYNVTRISSYQSPIELPEEKKDFPPQKDYLKLLTDKELEEEKEEAEAEVETAGMVLLHTSERGEGDRLQQEKKEAEESLSKINEEITKRQKKKNKFLC